MVSYLQFYCRKDVQKRILEAAKDREVAFKFGDKGFGKRPDILQFEGDIFEMAKQGVTSFHVSEERWSNPLDLSTGMNKKQLDDLRTGWDLIIDVDCKFFEYSRVVTGLVVEALRFHDIEDFSLKFSGNKGFHVGIPFESFPEKVNNIPTVSLFPDGPRVIAAYLKELINDPLSAALLSKNTIDDIATNVGKPKEELLTEGVFNPFVVADIDTILISSRHMFRAPFSINEKSGLVSIPLKPESLANFKPDDAKPGNVSTAFGFLSFDKIPNASKLIIQAFDWYSKQSIKKNETAAITKELSGPKKDFEALTTAIKADYFPPCILKIMGGVKEDGRKRALFILLNFLKSCGWSPEDIKEFVCEKWNKNNYEILKEGYILSQLSWHKRQPKVLLPPNCDNKSYYIDLRLCSKDGLCNKVKNPVNYAIIKYKLMNRPERRRSKKESK
ncbi:hypothetical protein FJZ53_00845 [Candidatus Woesearchaeota archaeon]|nr:hypothetical protein [Candidatus Woesearchaeota archaeon]